MIKKSCGEPPSLIGQSSETRHLGATHFERKQQKSMLHNRRQFARSTSLNTWSQTDRIVTGDEKWCFYVNMKQRKEWLSPDKQETPRAKQDLHLRKTMLCVWWDWEGIIHYKLLERNQTLNAELYVQQMHRLNEAIQRKRPNRRYGVLLQHDNARSHTANMTKAPIQELEWEVLPHPPYSPDLAPSDFHLFPSLSNALRDVSFNNDVELRAWLDEFFE